jgi:hypothetical protein
MRNANKRQRFVTVLFVLGIAAAAAFAVFAGNGSAARSQVPSNTTPPTISGSAQVGSTFTANNGTWDGTPTSYTYQWLRCDADGGSCSSISGAHDKTYTLKSVDSDNTLRVRVTAKNASGSASATSVPTAVVKATPKPPVTGCPSGNGPAKITDISQPARLTVDRFSVNPSVVTRSSSNVTVQVHVSACNQSVQGALVYVTAVPFDQFSIEDEATTDSNGTATITMHQLKGFPADRNQQLLAMMIRARKPGEDLLGGVSTRRLVSTQVSLRQ